MENFLPFLKVQVLHNEHTIALYMNSDQTFYVTIKALQLAEMNEEKLALLVCHELGHYLLDHSALRQAKAWVLENVFTNYFQFHAV